MLQDFIDMIQHKEYQETLYRMSKTHFIKYRKSSLHIGIVWLKQSTKQLKACLHQVFELQTQVVDQCQVEYIVQLLKQIKLCIRLGVCESKMITHTNPFFVCIEAFYKYDIWRFSHMLQDTAQARVWKRILVDIFDVLNEMVSSKLYAQSISTLHIPMISMLYVQVFYQEEKYPYHTLKYHVHVSSIIEQVYGTMIRNGHISSLCWFTTNQNNKYQSLRKKDSMKRILQERDEFVPEAKKCCYDSLRNCSSIIAEYESV